jgi:hypothetical protein
MREKINAVKISHWKTLLETDLDGKMTSQLILVK